LQTVAAAAAAAARDAVEIAMNSPETAPRAPIGAESEPPAAEAERPFDKFTGNLTGNFTGTVTPPSLGPAVPVEPVEPAPDLVIRPPRQRSSLPAVIAPQPKRIPFALLTTIVVIAVLASAGVAAYFNRGAIVDKLPAGWRSMLHL
jgi:hypothetical protein